MKFQVAKKDLVEIFEGRLKPEPLEIEVKNPRLPNAKAIKVKQKEDFAFQPKDGKLPDGFLNIGGIPIRETDKGPVVANIRKIREFMVPRPWAPGDWKVWDRITGNDCKFVSQKPSKVEIPVLPLTRMCRVTADCARVFTLNNLGRGCVINVNSEIVEADFTVTPNPSPNPPYPNNLPAPAVVSPFAKGGINNKYKKLYVPASFYTQDRQAQWGGFYVAVVDIDTASPTYLQTVSWIDCGWIPEEVSFTDDEETGVITNYMQGTATIFRASDGIVLAAEVDLFTGAGAGPGGALSRSVRCANVPGIGNRAFVTLTTESPSPGVAIINLDDPAFPRTNFTHPSFGFIDGIAVTPEKTQILLVQSSKLHVVQVDSASPSLVRSIDLPTGDGQSYFGGIGVRPSGNLAFVATGSANSSSPTQGTTLAQVNYDASPYAIEMPQGLAAQTWGVEMASFGSPLKPHIFVCSSSGMLTIIPC